MKIFVLFLIEKMANRLKKHVIKCALQVTLVSSKMINQILSFSISQKSMYEKLNYISISIDMQSFPRLIFSSEIHQDRVLWNLKRPFLSKFLSIRACCVCWALCSGRTVKPSIFESDIGQTNDTCQYVEPTELERFVETLSRDYYEGHDWNLDIDSDCLSSCKGGYCPAVCGAGGFCCSGTIADNGNCPDSANDAFRRINPNPFGKHFCMTPS